MSRKFRETESERLEVDMESEIADEMLQKIAEFILSEEILFA
jgi:hypothetical protein